MIHWLQSPKSAQVAKYVECYWMIEKMADSSSYQYPKLNPDPCAHLIISPQNQAYHYDLNPGVAAGEGSHWLFPHKQTLELDHSDPFIHIGVKFKTGAMYSLPDFSDEPLSLDRIDPLKGSALYSELRLDESALIDAARRSPDQCCELLDALLDPWLTKCKEDQYSKLTIKALKNLGNASISELGNQLHCSQRTLERSFQRVTGLTLKQCQSMNRLEDMLEYVSQRDAAELDWVDVAFKFGFSDQPHLIRYLKKQLGFTPKTYEKERGLTIDAYGGVRSNSTSS